MQDPRIDRLASILLDHSCQLRAGERILIEAIDLPNATLICKLVEGAAERGAVPFVTWKQQAALRSLYRTATEQGMQLAGQFERARMEQMQAYIGVRGASNASQMADVPAERMELYQKHWWTEVHTKVRVPKTKWVVLRYPTDSFAQAAGMSTAAFEDFYFDVCTADYAAMGRAQEPLVRRMEQADRVRITAPGTELEFSIRGIPVIPCNGHRNIPDGEVFTAPVRDSVNGVIRYNTPTRYQGVTFSDVSLEFERGKIVKATSSDTPRINKIFDSDEGARYIGEWSLGTNNRVRTPMLDTLFDEKIGGSFHLTPGGAYEIADNGNRSCVHWDMVLIQRADCGGGDIWFDGELLRRDGLFVPDDLQGLNEGL